MIFILLITKCLVYLLYFLSALKNVIIFVQEDCNVDDDSKNANISN